jgi:hypothetical protein
VTGDACEMTRIDKAFVLTAGLLATSQILLAVYRSRLLDANVWLGVCLGALLFGTALMRLAADRARTLHIVSATLGSILIVLGTWLSYGVVTGGGAISLVERVAASAMTLSLGVLLCTSARSARWRAIVGVCFVVAFAVLQIAVTFDVRWEASQRARGIYRMWR